MTDTVSVVLGFLALFVTIITSAIGVAAWLTSRLTRLETNLEHAFKRIDAIEKRSESPRPTARKRK